MANIITTPSPAHAIEPAVVIRSVADSRDRADMLAALEQYEASQVTLRNFGIPHLAADARAKLEAEGIETCDDPSFRHLFLQRAAPADAASMEYIIDGRMVARLEGRVSPILSRMRKRAAEALIGKIPDTRAAEAIAESLGLPASSAVSELVGAMRRAIVALKESAEQPCNLQNNGQRRGTLSQYFPKAL